MMMPVKHRWFVFCSTLAVLTTLVSSPAAAQDRIGGHFGAVFPIVTRSEGTTTTIEDDFKVGFPMGITIKTTDVWAFDLELVPVISRQRFSSLTVHPGVVRALPKAFAAGMRMAFDVGAASWGFTPLLNHTFRGGRQPYFIEAVLPIRFQQNDAGANHTSLGFGAHIGVGF
jgi:hypothetical protein